MKILDTPRSGKLGLAVAFKSRYGLCLREWLVPKKTITPARLRVWGAMGYFARAWSAMLTEAQRERWIVGAGNVLSANRMDCGPLTGQQFFESINCARACIDLPPFLEAPPPREPFGPNPVGPLTVVSRPQGLRLLLAVTGPVTADIMVFGQAPCSRGRYKRRNVAYLGLVTPQQDGFADITDIYTAKYGPLRPNTKIFILTRQQKNGWESPDKETSAVVPEEEKSPHSTVHSPQSEPNVAVSTQPVGQQASAKPASPLPIHMHTGATRDAQGTLPPRTPPAQESNKPRSKGGQPAKSGIDGVGGPAEDSGGSG